MEKAVKYIVSCKNLDGGFGCTPGGESHSGQSKLHKQILFHLTQFYWIFLIINVIMLFKLLKQF